MSAPIPAETSAAQLSVALRHRLSDRFTLDVAFSCGAGVTALFGRSGSGKTTVVNAVAGLFRPSWGKVSIGRRVLMDSEAGVFTPPHRRHIGYVFQEGRLLPHLTVRQNLLYGRLFTPRAERWGSLDEVVAMLGIGALLDRRPGALSGGEKQRVAIGRALLSCPSLLLLDEPLAALDAQRKAEILPYLERLRDEARLPILFVSHSIGEVARLADRMVLLSDGRVDAVGTVAAVMGRLDLYPVTGRFEAGALLEAVVVGPEEPALTRMRAPGGDLLVPRIDAPPGTRLRTRIRSRDVILALHRPDGLSALNALPAVVAEIRISEAGIADVQVMCGGDPLLARVTQRAVDVLGLAPGREVFAVVKSIAFDSRTLGRSRERGPDSEDGEEGLPL